MALDVVSAGSGDVTRVPLAVISPLPLSDSSGTRSTSLHTPDDTIATYPVISAPGAVFKSVQIGVMTVPVDRPAIVLLVSEVILSISMI